MRPFEIFSIIGIALTALLGIYNLWLNIKGQRKSQRELIFNRQFDFFVQLQSLFTEFEDNLHDFNEPHSDINTVRESIFRLSNEIDTYITKNEILIPDELYSKINQYSIDCHKLSAQSFKEPTKITQDLKKEMINNSVVLIDAIREYIGIERLSEENRNLVRRHS